MKYNRVLVFSTDDHLYPAGGAEQAFGNITERLPHIEFDLICAKLRKGAAAYEKVKNVHIYRMGFGIKSIDGIILALFGHFCAYKLMQKHTYDFVWSIMASYGAFSAVRVKRKKNLPFLLTLQEGDSFEYIYKKVRFVRKQFNEIFEYADGIQAISNYLLRWSMEMGFVGKYAEIIPNGVAIELFNKKFISTDLELSRASFNFPETALIMITSSRLVPKNGIEDVIRALALLPEDVCLVVCGDGFLSEHMHNLVQEFSLESRVRFMGFVQPAELPKLMKASDVFIRPSLSEGLGNAFLEAMASRLLVIGTHVGGIPDFLIDGKTGFVVLVNDPKSIADVVTKIRVLKSEERIEMLDRAEQMILDKYNWDLVSMRVEKLFNKIAS